MLSLLASNILMATPDLLPVYHFTRAQNEMNDPNGLMYLPQPSTTFPTIAYHMFFQSNNPGQSLGSEWGHAISPDMVNWKRQNRTGIKGSSGGGVSLPRGTTDHPDWRGAAFASVPIDPPRHPAVGLSLWFSTDEDLSTWQLYEGHEGECAGTTGTTPSSSAVICPSIVPNSTRAGYIGDNYVWKEGPDSSPTFYLLSGSNRCAEGSNWCGYGAKGSTAQGLLFSSTNLTSWTFDGVFYENKTAQRLDTPDTFSLQTDGEAKQVLLWLTGGHTEWMVGSLQGTRTCAGIEENTDDLGDDISSVDGVGCADECAGCQR